MVPFGSHQGAARVTFTILTGTNLRLPRDWDARTALVHNEEKMEATDMKSPSTSRFILGSAICIMAFAALNTTALAEPKANRQAQAESMGYQCRAAVRAELKGPNCRMAIPPNPTSPCNIPSNAEVEIMDNKVFECVSRGGPGRQSKT
jgi:hypothetical protein